MIDQIEDADRPLTPAPEDCCGNACDPCIFDIHKKLLTEWECKKQNQFKVHSEKNFLSLIKYRKVVIRDIIKASEDSILMTLYCASESNNDIVRLNPGQHIIIKFSSTSKPYTPISWSGESLKLLIKLYPNGEASNFIKQLKKDDELFIRGPYGDFQYRPNSFKHVIMLSIGSGIAAIYPIAVCIVKNESENTKINMLSGFHSLSHVPLKDELRHLTDYWNFECTLCLSQKSVANITGIKIINSRINGDLISKILDTYAPESSLILICGSLMFNTTFERVVREKKFRHYYSFQ